MLKRRWKIVRGKGMDDLKERVTSGSNMTDTHELTHAQSLHRFKPDGHSVNVGKQAQSPVPNEESISN